MIVVCRRIASKEKAPENRGFLHYVQLFPHSFSSRNLTRVNPLEIPGKARNEAAGIVYSISIILRVEL